MALLGLTPYVGAYTPYVGSLGVSKQMHPYSAMIGSLRRDT